MTIEPEGRGGRVTAKKSPTKTAKATATKPKATAAKPVDPVFTCSECDFTGVQGELKEHILDKHISEDVARAVIHKYIYGKDSPPSIADHLVENAPVHIGGTARVKMVWTVPDAWTTVQAAEAFMDKVLEYGLRSFWLTVEDLTADSDDAVWIVNNGRTYTLEQAEDLDIYGDED